jgi:hypothetical protein
MHYETALKSAKFLIFAHGTTDEAAKAKSFLGTVGSARIALHPEERGEIAA